ncbi:hypothetical protein [Daejeonella sp.]|uniref:hypothetical protein n=1 Tax=Daejeonella sp. TaxID=2805397 RepID=UPI0030C54EE0
MKNDNKSEIALAIIAGIAAGTAAWYFMSSDKGKENWSTLLNTLRDVTDRLMEAGAEKGSLLAAAGREASEYISEKAGDVMDDAKQQYAHHTSNSAN